MQAIKILKNKTAALLLSADFFETIGTSIYNIILLTYAKSFVHPKLFVSVVSISMIVPGIFGFILGKLSDQTRRKSMSFTSMKFCQFLLYMLLAVIILKKNIITFIITILINMTSSCIGQYCDALRATIIQKRIDKKERKSTLGLSTAISSLVVPFGQSIGVVILKVTKAYYLAAIANALSFLISGLITLFGQKLIYYCSSSNPKITKRVKINMDKIKEAVYKSTTLSFLNFMICFGILNAVAVGLNSAVNLFFVSYPRSTPFSFSVSLVIINTFGLIGSILGNTTDFSWLKNKNVKTILIYSSVVVMGVYFNLLTFKNFWITVLLEFVADFIGGALNPILDSKLMQNTDPAIMGSMWGMIGTLATVSIPFGSVGLVLIYNAISPQAMFIVAIAFMLVAIALLMFNLKKSD